MKKEVRFSKVIITVFCLNDKEECRKSDWEIYARNTSRLWFARRIARIQVSNFKSGFKNKIISDNNK
jgi:hypothetical protein